MKTVYTPTKKERRAAQKTESICAIGVIAHSGRFGVRERKTASTPGEGRVGLPCCAPKPESVINSYPKEQREGDRRYGCEKTSESG